MNLILVRYLELCDAFRHSKIWKDTDSVKLFEIDHVKGDAPILQLYAEVYKACKILERLNAGESIQKNYDGIRVCAYNISCAIDNRMDVKDDTSNDAISVKKVVTQPLLEHFGYPNETTINRTFLSNVSWKVYEELDGYMISNNIKRFDY